jgi:hypothetical protein
VHLAHARHDLLPGRRYVITDTGAKNQVVVNGRPLGSGSQARLGDGGKIKVGDYLLEVAVTAHRAPQVASSSVGAWPENPFDPFADFSSPADLSASRADPVIPPQAPPVAPTQTPSGSPRSPEFSAQVKQLRGGPGIGQPRP